ncbi:hypothetical protein SUGI_0532090 [Cryptomeria japonica]|nr:hypothetical protein SUGI_0532090 [Cryptomeria japonica]
MITTLCSSCTAAKFQSSLQSAVVIMTEERVRQSFIRLLNFEKNSAAFFPLCRRANVWMILKRHSTICALYITRVYIVRDT